MGQTNERTDDHAFLNSLIGALSNGILPPSYLCHPCLSPCPVCHFGEGRRDDCCPAARSLSLSRHRVHYLLGMSAALCDTIEVT